MDLDPAPQKKARGGLIAAIVVLIALVVGGILFFNQQKTGQKTGVITPTVQPLPSETPTPVASTSATPSVTKKPSPTTGAVTKATDMNIQVLNGSGKEGVAGEVKTFLTGKGYKNFETGNADNFNYEGVTVKIKSSRQQFLSDLQNALKEKYTLASSSGTLSSDALFDAQVIVGK